MQVEVPPYLAEEFGTRDPEWLAALPTVVEELAARWELTLDAPLGDPPRASGWVAPGVTSDGTSVFLKVGWPHREAETEAAGLRFFDGRGAVRLLAHDDPHFAVLTERVIPGDPLTDLGVDEGNRVAVSVLEQLWRAPEPDLAAIGLLATTVEEWNARFPRTRRDYPAGLVSMADELGSKLVETQDSLVVVHGDFNPTNVLRNHAGGWLAIDPKPLIGDPAYDLAQFLANRIDDAEAGGNPADDLTRQVRFFAAALDLSPVRIAGWTAVKAVGWNWGSERAALLRGVYDQICSTT